MEEGGQMKTGTIDGKVDQLWQVVYDSGELGAAATTINVTGLEGDTDEEYYIITRFINAYAGVCSVQLKINNNSDNIYGRQIIAATGASINPSRSVTNLGFGVGAADDGECSFSYALLKAKSGYGRTFHELRAYLIDGTDVNDLITQGAVWDNTVDEITSLNFNATETDGFGVGTRIIILKKVDGTSGMRTGELDVQGSITGAWEKIYENELTGATNSVTVSGLAGNTDQVYKVITKFRNNYNGTTQFYILLNNDSGANYGVQEVLGQDSTASASHFTALTYFGQTASYTQYNLSLTESLIYAKSGYTRTMLTNDCMDLGGTTILRAISRGFSWDNSGDELTSMVFTTDQTDGMATGTVIEVWKLNL